MRFSCIRSSVNRIVKIIKKLLSKSSHFHYFKMRLPKIIIRFMNIYYNRKYSKENNLYFENYYDELVHKEPEFLEEMVRFFNTNR